MSVKLNINHMILYNLYLYLDMSNGLSQPEVQNFSSTHYYSGLCCGSSFQACGSLLYTTLF